MGETAADERESEGGWLVEEGRDGDEELLWEIGESCGWFVVSLVLSRQPIGLAQKELGSIPK